MGFCGGIPGSGSFIKRLLSKYRDKPAYHQQVYYSCAALHVIGGHHELASLCEESHELHPEVKLYWDMHSSIAQAEGFPDNQAIDPEANAINGAEERHIVGGIVDDGEVAEHVYNDTEDAGEE